MTADQGGLSSLKALVTRAWRERWSDLQFSIHLKNVLSSGSPVSALPEILIQQAVSGSAPNSLILSYLNHICVSQVVPSSAVLKCILQFDDITRPHCVVSLVNFVKGLIQRIRTVGSCEVCITHACVLLRTVHWLLQLLLKSIQRLTESKTTSLTITPIVEAVADCFDVTVKTGYNRSLMKLAVKENTEMFRELEQMESDVRALLLHAATGSVKDMVDSCLQLLASLHTPNQQSDCLLDLPHIPSLVSLIIGFEAVLNPMGEIKPFVDQILLMEKLQATQRADTYCNMLHTCCVGLVDCADDPDELKWTAFTFLKLPAVLKRMFQLTPDRDNSDDLEQGFVKLLKFTSLLDLTELKCNCDLIQQLTELCEKAALLSKASCSRLTESRAASSRKPKPGEMSGSQPNASLILKAEPTVNSLLKTLDADYQKNQDALLGVLSHMLSGKSFELILVAAASTHKLHNFAVKLVKFNEFAKQAPGEGGRAAATRALLFDISFLMLCHMTQTYGIELVAENPESRDSFFVQWSSKYMGAAGTGQPETDHTDPSKVDNLLMQLIPGGELKNSLTRWHEVCMNMPGVIQEVLNAATCGAISGEKLKAILDNIKSRLCSLPVVACGWLCSYISTMSEANRHIPLGMIRQLMTSVQVDPQSPNSHYSERSHLMNVILKKMIQTVEPVPTGNKSIGKLFVSEELSAAFKNAYSKKWVDLQATKSMERLLSVAGPDWLCLNLVKEMLKFSRVEDLSRSIALVLSLMYIDLETLVISLLRHVVPHLVQLPSKSQLLIDPRGHFVAKLCIAAIAAVTTSKTFEKERHPVKSSRKRRRVDYDVDSYETEQPNKVRKLQPTDEVSFHSEGFNMDQISANVGIDQTPKYDTRDPVNQAMASLFRLFDAVADDNTTSHVTCFVISFLKEAIISGEETHRYVLQFLAPSYNLVAKLARKMPRALKDDDVLKLCDASTQSGRKVAAKVLCDLQKIHSIQQS